jgi:hypothetical protein
VGLYEEIIQSETLASIRAQVVGYAQAAGLVVTNWISGGVGEQILQTVSTLEFAKSGAIAKAIRGFTSLALSVDPGDADPYDSTNVTLAPAPGLLSAFGENTFGTQRAEATLATGFALFDNSAGAVARTFAPYALTWTWTVDLGGGIPDPPPTYRNAEDPTIYTNIDGTVTVLAGATLLIPIVAEEVGTRSNAGVGALSLTTTLTGVVSSNTTAIVGADREAADVYRDRCRQAGSRLSFAGPADAYAYFAAKQLDGTPLLNELGAPVAITRAQVTQESDTGIVNVWFADDDGAPISEDVDAANANIELYAFVVPGAITYTGAAAVDVVVPTSGTVKVKNAPGVTEAAVRAAILAKMAATYAAYPVGGRDQVAGAGVLYKSDLQGALATAYPGIYDPAITTPAAATTALAAGRVAKMDSDLSDWTVVLT